MRDPFGDLLRKYCARKRGLTQRRLAHMTGYDPAILVRMGQGKKDLTGPSGRDRVVRIIEALRDEGVLSTLSEANALLSAAVMPPLFEAQPAEQALIRSLAPDPGPPSTTPLTLPVQRQTYPFWSVNLPAPLTNFIGRERDVAEVKRLLNASRLVTLTGPGGVGKTRLALQAAQEVLNEFAHGACFVALAPIDDPALVPAAIARALGVREQPGQPILEGVASFLRHKQLLLVLDNYERLLGAATVATELLTHTPQLKVLATSRVPLRLSGEYELDVTPLELPAATTLFMHRAQAIRSQFALDDDNRAAVVEIVERIDRLPLAIELAAARIRHLSPQALLAQLHPPSTLHHSLPSLDGQATGGKGLSLLTDAPRDLPERQQTFRDTIDWSYQWLGEEEQRWFRRLGVFAGGAALEQVAALDPALHGGEGGVERVLQSLAEKSLVRAEAQPDGRKRYSLLELIREYALVKLAECDELAEVQRRLTLAYLALAQTAEQNLHNRAQKTWLLRLEQENDNFRAALARSLAAGGDVMAGLRLANHLWPFWEMGHRAEGRQWLTLLLDRAGEDAPPALRGRALLGLGILLDILYEWDAAQAAQAQALDLLRRAGDPEGMAMALSESSVLWGLTSPTPTTGDVERSMSLAEEGLALSRQTNSELAIARALAAYAHVLWWRRDCERARMVLEDILERSEKTGDAREMASACFWLGTIALYQLDFVRATSLAEKALQTARLSGSYGDLAVALFGIGEVAQLTRDLDKAQACLEESHALSVEYGLSYEAGFTLTLLGRVARDRGDYDRAHALFAEALAHFPRPVRGPYGIEGLACLAVAREQHARAARLFGFVEAYRETTHDPWWPKDHHDLGPYMNTARAQLGEEIFANAWAEGREMSLEQAVEYALADQV